MNTLSDWLQLLEQRSITRATFALDDVTHVAQDLKLLQFNCPVVTIGGTNGKGSCVRLLEAIMSAAGYRVAVYTSPHLLKFNERIRCDGIDADDETLCAAFAAINNACGDIQLNYFELATLAALQIFQKQQPDLVILEVGVGGRLDATNIVNADIAVLSSIDLDHIQWLGTDRESIGLEKAGIFRPHQPVVIGDKDAPNSVKQCAVDLACPLYLQGIHFSYHHEKDWWTWKSMNTELTDLPLPSLMLENAATILQVVELLAAQFTVSLADIRQGLQEAILLGRYQILPGTVNTILDVAHNPQACLQLAKRLQAEASQESTTHAVVGMNKDKDLAGCLLPLKHVVDFWHVADLETERSAQVVAIKNTLETYQIQPVECYSSVEQAYKTAQALAKKGDQIVVFGSFRTVEKVLRM